MSQLELSLHIDTEAEGGTSVTFYDGAGTIFTSTRCTLEAAFEGASEQVLDGLKHQLSDAVENESVAAPSSPGGRARSGLSLVEPDKVTPIRRVQP